MSTLQRKAVFVFVLFFLFAVHLNAKKVQGVVVDLKSNAPISGVTLMLISDNSMKDVAFSDSSGYFWFNVTEVDSFYLKTFSTGYVNINVGAFKITNLDSMNITVKLDEQAYMLDEIEVTAERLDQLLDRVGYLDRKEQLHGSFFSRVDIRERNFIDLTSVFRLTPSMKVVTDQYGNTRIYSMRAQVSLSRDNMGIGALIYVDGILVEDSQYYSPLDMIPIEDVAGIEVYSSPIDAPAQYSRGQYKPIVLIWTGGEL